MAGTREQAIINGKKGGRKLGGKNVATIVKEQVQEKLTQRVFGIIPNLITAQASLARGQQFLYKIEKEFVKTGGTNKNGEEKGYWRNLKPKLVTSEWEIQSYVDGKVEEGDMEDQNDSGATYYYITTKEPDNQAIDSLLDRVLGKPKNEDTAPKGNTFNNFGTFTGVTIKKDFDDDTARRLGLIPQHEENKKI